jgi:hypothetical protein
MADTAIAALQAFNSYRMARLQLRFMRKQMDLAEGYLEIFANQREFYRSVFRPKTEDVLRVLAVDPVFTPNYLARYAYAQTLGIGINFVKYERINFNSASGLAADSYYDRRGQMYSLPKSVYVELQNYRDTFIYAIHADIQNHLFRYEEYKENIWGQRRYDRFVTVGEYSNKSAVAMAQDGAASFGLLSNAVEAKGNLYGAMANDFAASAGALFQKAMTPNPSDMMRFPQPNVIPKKNEVITNARIGTPMEDYSARMMTQVQRPYVDTVKGGRMVK